MSKRWFEKDWKVQWENNSRCFNTEQEAIDFCKKEINKRMYSLSHYEYKKWFDGVMYREENDFQYKYTIDTIKNIKHLKDCSIVPLR